MQDKEMSRVQLLISHKRYQDAEKIIKELLTNEPNNINLLATYAELSLQLKESNRATALIDNAIGLAPDYGHLFYIKSRICLDQDKWQEAEDNIQIAINNDPFDSDFFALHAQIKLSRKQFEKSLNIANQALEIDPENLLALNVRSTALNKLDRTEESYSSIQGALREDPNNPYTHANFGWGLLEKGDHEKALIHFKEALKADADFEFAQAGMLEAIKASNPIYRLFLKYAFWMSNLTSKYQWGVIIGFYLGFRFLNKIAAANPDLQPFLNPLLVILALIAFSTWVITPISNLFLRFNKYGKVLLDDKEKMSSNFVALSFSLFVIGGLLYLLLGHSGYIALALFGFTMMVPLSHIFAPSKYKNTFFIYSIVMAVIGTLAVGISFNTNDIINPVSIIYFLGFIAFQWGANFLFIKEDDR